MLESRRLLSAAPASVMAPMISTRAGVHAHATIPNIIDTFVGAYTDFSGQVGEIIIGIFSESKAGKVAGEVTVVNIGTLPVTGTVNAKGKVSLHGSENQFTLNASGTVSSDLDTLFGKYNTTSKHGKHHHGSFSSHKATTSKTTK